MAGYKAQLLMSIRAHDQSKRELAGVSRNFQKTGRAGNKAGKSVAAGWRTALGVMRGAAAAYGIVMVKQMAEAGRASLAVESAFKRLNKESGQLLKTMRVKSGSLLDDTSLQVIANKLQAIGTSGKDMGRILEVSMKLAASSGRDYKEVTEQLTQAIVTGRAQSFQSLGIIVDAKAAVKEYAAEHGKAVADLTMMETAQAKLNKAIKATNEAVGNVDTSGYVEEIGKADATTKNFYDLLTRGAYAAERGFVAGIMGAADGVLFLGEAVEDYIGVSNRSKEATRESNEALDKYARDAFKAATAARTTAQHSAALVEALGGLKNVLPAIRSGLRGMAADALTTAAGLHEAQIQAKELASVKQLEKESGNLDKYLALLKTEQDLNDKSAKSTTAADKARLAAVSGRLLIMEKEIPNAQAVYMEFLDGVVAKDKEATEDWLANTRKRIEANAELLTTALMPEGAGGAGAAPDQTPALQAAVVAAERELAVTEGLMTEKERIESEYFDHVDLLRAQGMAQEDLALSLDLARLETRRAMVAEDIRIAQAEAAAKQKGIDDVLRAQQKADAQKLRMEAARKTAEAKAAVAYSRNIDNTISITASGLKMFAGTQRAMNLIDAARETAQSIKSFASLDFFGGAAHALAAGSFVKAATIAGRHGGGGGGGAGAAGGGGSVSPSTDNRFEGATATDQGQGGNVINLYGFMGDEERLGHYITGTINVASQTGARISDQAIDSMARGY